MFSSRVLYEAEIKEFSNNNGGNILKVQAAKSYPIWKTGFISLFTYGLPTLFLPWKEDVDDLKQEIDKNLTLRLGIEDYAVEKESVENNSFSWGPLIFSYQRHKLDGTELNAIDQIEVYTSRDPNYFSYKKHQDLPSDSSTFEGLSINRAVDTQFHSNHTYKKHFMNINGDALFFLPMGVGLGYVKAYNNLEFFISRIIFNYTSDDNAFILGNRVFLNEDFAKYLQVVGRPVFGFYLQFGLCQINDVSTTIDENENRLSTTSSDFGLNLGGGYQGSKGLGLKYQTIIKRNFTRKEMIPFYVTYTHWL